MSFFACKWINTKFCPIAITRTKKPATAVTYAANLCLSNQESPSSRVSCPLEHRQNYKPNTQILREFWMLWKYGFAIAIDPPVPSSSSSFSGSPNPKQNLKKSESWSNVSPLKPLPLSSMNKQSNGVSGESSGSNALCRYFVVLDGVS